MLSDDSQHGPTFVGADMIILSRRFCVNHRESLRCSMDMAFCIRCLVWPPQAAEWQTRRREHGWPDTATIDCIINTGCDIVHVAHTRCGYDEVMNKAQWRLSFSRAETVLLKSWSPKQQLVYHVLRVVITIIQSQYKIAISRRYYL